MAELLPLLAGLLALFRTAVFAAVAAGAVLCAVSWGVRTRRLNPFGGLGRLSRERVDPMLAPVQRAVRNAGGSEASVPWWGLAALALLGIVLVQVVEYAVGIVASVALASANGGSALLRVLVSVTFSVLELAILVRVIGSWFPALERSRWLRWAWAVSEPLLAPLRRVVPTLGPIDISPMVALLLLQVVGRFVVGGL